MSGLFEGGEGGGREARVVGDWFAAGESARREAVACFGRGAILVTVGEERRYAALGDVRLSARLAGVARRLEFPCGGVLVVVDSDALDAALAAAGGRRRGGGVLHAVERRWSGVVAVAAAALVAAGGVYAALPWVSDAAAARVPASYLQEAGEVVLRTLHDQEVLHESRLEAAEVWRVRRLFAVAAGGAEVREGVTLRVAARRFAYGTGGRELANAFALPDGLVVPTDALVRRLSDEELLAVLAHEVGHVAAEHAARGIMRAAVVGGLVVLLSGDFSGLSLAPVFLLNLKYSRDFEREADCYAYGFLARQGMDSGVLEASLAKLEAFNAVEGEGGSGEEGGVGGLLAEVLTTHPRERGAEAVGWEEGRACW